MTHRVCTLLALLIGASGCASCGATDSTARETATAGATESPPESAADERATPVEAPAAATDGVENDQDDQDDPVGVVQEEMDWEHAPGPRMNHAAIFTGTHLVIWGGDDAWPSETDGYAPVPTHGIATGGLYDPRTNSWSPTATRGAPPGAYDAVAVWTGTEMIVWGGERTEHRAVNTGGRYEPSSDRWRPTSRRGAPSPCARAAAVWTGTEIIVWGGRGRHGPLGDGARYDPASNAWTPMTNGAAPTPRSGHSAVWTGTEIIVWGGLGTAGELDDGGRYDPSTDTWRPMSKDGAPSVRTEHVAVYTGEAMIVWGGHTGSWQRRDRKALADGALYSPATDSWRPMSTEHTYARDGAEGVWTGTHLVVLGEADADETGMFPTPALGLYDPADDSWTYFAGSDAYGRSLVLGDAEIFGWGGTDGTNILGEGVRMPLPLRPAP